MNIYKNKDDKWVIKCHECPEEDNEHLVEFEVAMHNKRDDLVSMIKCPKCGKHYTEKFNKLDCYLITQASGNADKPDVGLCLSCLFNDCDYDHSRGLEKLRKAFEFLCVSM